MVGKQKEKRTKEHEQLEATIKQLETDNAQLTEQWKRALADYQNLEKRIAKEKEDMVVFASERLIIKLLPALDTLRMAVAHHADDGLRLTLAAFEKVLQDEGVERIETKGRQFDPHFMECVVTVQGKENIVVEEMRVGYKRADRILRPAQVKVAVLSHPDPASVGEGSNKNI